MHHKKHLPVKMFFGMNFLNFQYNFFDILNSKTQPPVGIGTLRAEKVGDSVNVNVDDYSAFLFVLNTPDSYTGDTFIVPSGISAAFSSELRATPSVQDSQFYGYINMKWIRTGTLSVERIKFGTSWTKIDVEIYGIK